MLVVRFQSHFTRLWDEACEACELKIPLWQNSKCILYPITRGCKLSWFNLEIGIENQFACESIKASWT